MGAVNIPPIDTVWSDTNRFNQSGYSASTVWPIESNYIDKQAFKADLSAAEWRESNHQEFMDELRQEAAEEKYYNRWEQ